MMKGTKIFLGSFYWAEEIGVDDIIANVEKLNFFSIVATITK